MTDIRTANPVIDSMLARSTTSLYDPTFTMTDEQITELIRIATTAPSSFHLQNWRFIAVRTPEAKERLRPIAWDQPKITAAAVVFIIIGQLPDYRLAAERLATVVEAGIMPPEMVADYEGAAKRLYDQRPPCQRDEAIRSGTIAATAMMYAANAWGLGSTPMIAFDPQPLIEEFGLAADEVPVMLVAVGAKLPTNWPRKPRRAVEDILELV